LFALILSLGLLVDDPIVDVENIHRHYKLRKESPLEALLTAVDEVRPRPFWRRHLLCHSCRCFISPHMGPYMAPMAFNVPIAMIVSLIFASPSHPGEFQTVASEYHKHSDEAPEELKQLYLSGLSRGTRPLLATSGRPNYFYWSY